MFFSSFPRLLLLWNFNCSLLMYNNAEDSWLISWLICLPALSSSLLVSNRKMYIPAIFFLPFHYQVQNCQYLKDTIPTPVLNQPFQLYPSFFPSMVWILQTGLFIHSFSLGLALGFLAISSLFVPVLSLIMPIETLAYPNPTSFSNASDVHSVGNYFLKM